MFLIEYLSTYVLVCCTVPPGIVAAGLIFLLGSAAVACNYGATIIRRK